MIFSIVLSLPQTISQQYLNLLKTISSLKSGKLNLKESGHLFLLLGSNMELFKKFSQTAAQSNLPERPLQDSLIRPNSPGTQPLTFSPRNKITNFDDSFRFSPLRQSQYSPFETKELNKFITKDLSKSQVNVSFSKKSSSIIGTR